MKKMLYFLLLCTFCSCGNDDLQNQVNQLQNQVKELKEKSTTLSKKRPGLIHNVFFWLKEDLTVAQKKAFLEGVNSLGKVSTVREMYVGPPADTEERNVIDNTYSYALLVHFDDLKGQNEYQVDPIHLKFVDDHKDKWTKVTVYDNYLIEE